MNLQIARQLADTQSLADEINAEFDAATNAWRTRNDTFAFFYAEKGEWTEWNIDLEICHPEGRGLSVVIGRQYYEFKIGSNDRPLAVISAFKRTILATARHPLPKGKWARVRFERSEGVLRIYLERNKTAILEANDSAPRDPIKDVTFKLPKGLLFRNVSVLAGGKMRNSLKPGPKQRLLRSVTIDFNDDIMPGPWFPETVAQQMRYYKDSGIRRVYFLPTASMEDGYWNVEDCGRPGHREHFLKTRENLGDFLTTFAQCAKSHDMEFFAVLKPFEQGFERRVLPFDTTGNTIAGCYRSLSGIVFRSTNWMRMHPSLRLARHPADLRLANETGPIRKLVLSSELGGRFPAFSLWASVNNRNYTRIECKFHQISQNKIQFILPENTPPLLAIVREPGEDGPFGHRLELLVQCCDEGGQPVPISFATALNGYGKPVGEAFPEIALRFDTNFDSRQPVDSRESYWWMEPGIPLGITAGYEPFVIGAPSPVYAKVREFWLDEIRRCLTAGCDGVDIRVANHNGTLDWDRYGYSDPDGKALEAPPEDIRSLLGDHYTTFVKHAAQTIRSTGGKIHLHLEHGFRPANLPCDMNIEFQWQQWLEQGLADEVTLMDLSAAAGVMPQMACKSRECGIPVNIRPYFNSIMKGTHTERLIDHILHDAEAFGMDGLNIYENAHFFKVGETGCLTSSAERWWKRLTMP